MLAAFEEPSNIKKHLQEEHGIEIHINNVYWYAENKKDEIEEERDRVRHDLMAIPIANKFYRLQLRQRLVDDIFNKGLWAIMGTVEVEGRKLPRLKGNHNLINQVLNAVREEMEPFEIKLVNDEGKAVRPEFNSMIGAVKKYSPDDRRKILKLLDELDPNGNKKDGNTNNSDI